MSEQAAPERPATPEAPTVATYPGAVGGARYNAQGVFVQPVSVPGDAQHVLGKVRSVLPAQPPAPIPTDGTLLASPTPRERLTRDPRDTGEIYPTIRITGAVSFLRAAPNATLSTDGILVELARLLRPEMEWEGGPGSRDAKHLASCLYTLDGILRDARKLNLTPEAQERLRDLMIEMSRP